MIGFGYIQTQFLGKIDLDLAMVATVGAENRGNEMAGNSASIGGGMSKWGHNLRR